MSYVRPDFSAVRANAGEWRDYNAAGGGLTVPNIIAGIGSGWGATPQGFATVFANVDLDHGQIGQKSAVIGRLLGSGH